MWQVVWFGGQKGLFWTGPIPEKLIEINRQLSDTYSSPNTSEEKEDSNAEEEENEEQKLDEDEGNNKCKGNPCENSKFWRLIRCPFTACAMFHKPSGKWNFNFYVANHNHPASTNPCAHIENHCLTPAQFSKVKNLRKAKILRVMHTTKGEGKSLLATKNKNYVAKLWMKMESTLQMTVPENLHMQKGGVWMTAWLKHAACQLQAKLMKKSCIIGLSLSKCQLLAIFIPASNNSLLSKTQNSSTHTLTLKEKHNEIKSIFHKQIITSLQNINIIFTTCHSKSTNFALWNAKFCYVIIDLTSKGQCNQTQTVQTGIPCRNGLDQLFAFVQKLEPSYFHRHWHLKVSFFHFYLSSH
ncbi:hypothetical protein VP01_2081g5 [Puccinia sorghi]|uniref:Uncharacterized protein n=1 Tax=Puccinia sorghi TaxID=27349 RepID=A0A0L6VAL5_9BASI|nr:hypothetical protein VP01_2081g5 [Puccinia sorghi]